MNTIFIQIVEKQLISIFFEMIVVAVVYETTHLKSPILQLINTKRKMLNPKWELLDWTQNENKRVLSMEQECRISSLPALTIDEPMELCLTKVKNHARTISKQT